MISFILFLLLWGRYGNMFLMLKEKKLLFKKCLQEKNLIMLVLLITLLFLPVSLTLLVLEEYILLLHLYLVLKAGIMK